MRGERRLGVPTELMFKYHLAGADKLRVEMVHAKAQRSWTKELKDLPRDAWLDATLRFEIPHSDFDEHWADEIRLFVPAGATLTIDDVLLYMPGQVNAQGIICRFRSRAS